MPQTQSTGPKIINVHVTNCTLSCRSHDLQTHANPKRLCCYHTRASQAIKRALRRHNKVWPAQFQHEHGKFEQMVTFTKEKRRPERCSDLKKCDSAGYCPKDMDCLGIFGLCYSTNNAVNLYCYFVCYVIFNCRLYY